MKKIFTIIVLLLSVSFLQAQHLFSVKYNELSNDEVTQLKSQIPNPPPAPASGGESHITNSTSQIPHLTSHISYLISENNTKIIILNEDNGKQVVITPEKETLTEFQLTPFFIEELKQSILGDAEHYLVMESSAALSVKNIASVAVSNEKVSIPQYFYGKKENVKEALPQERQIIGIYKQKPRLILADPDDVEMQRYAAQKEEEMSYYVYMYQLPDGTKCTYREHPNKNSDKNLRSGAGNFLKFNLTGILNEKQRLATEYALELWSEQLAGTVPFDLEVNFVSMGQGVLGMSFFPECFEDTITHIWYPSALWNQMVDCNANPDEKDNEIWMNSDYSFYLGLDGNGTGMDFVTIAIHEVTHGLGFGCYCSFYDGEFFWGDPGIYDCQLYQGLDGPCFIDLPNYERATLMVSNNMYAGGPGSNLLKANEWERVKIYAPYNYSGGSSAHHWDSSVGFPTFMKYAYDYPLHTFNDRKLGILTDMGWELPVIDSANVVWVTFNNNGGIGNRNPQPFLPENRDTTQQYLKICPFSKIGHTFKEWNTEPDGSGTTYLNRGLYSFSNNTELYAQWEANTYVLEFYAMGGTVDPLSKNVVYGLPIGELPIPVREGYIFQGWRISANNIISEEMIWNYTMDRPVLAQWTPQTAVMENQSAESIQIAPNPTTGELTINNEQLIIKSIEILDVYGKKQKAESRKQNVIDISKLQTGIYFVRITTENGIITKKIIKN